MNKEKLSPEEREAVRLILNYTDEQLDKVEADEKRRAVAKHAMDLTRKRLIFECIETQNCMFHRVGDKYVFSGFGSLIKEESCERPCLYAMANFLPFSYMLYDRVASDLDPDGMVWYSVPCSDPGDKCGGWGSAKFKVRVVDAF
jgi:uncharacterized repeat protein (TIGR04076 family)